MSYEHTCPHEAIIRQNLRNLQGNGDKGLVKEVAELKKEVQMICESIEKLSTSYSALVKSQIEHDAVEKTKADARKQIGRAIQNVGTVFGIVVGIVGLVYIILDYIFK